MAKRTKKVGSTGRFGSRYGVKSKSRIRNVEIIQKAKHRCPNCGHMKVKRVSTSIWQCKKCGIKFAGGAYYPKTESGQNVEKMIKGEFIKTSPSSEEPKKEEVIPKGEKA